MDEWVFDIITDIFVLSYEWFIYILFSATIFRFHWKDFRWKYGVFILIPVFMQWCTFLGLPDGCRIIGILLLGSLLTRILFRKPMFLIIITNVIWCMVSFVSDFLVMGIFYLMNPQNGLDLLLGNKLVWFQGAYLSKSFSFFFVMLFCKILKKGRHAYNRKELAVAILQGATSAFCLLVICNISLYIDRVPEVSPCMLLAASLVIMITFVLTFEIYERYLQKLNWEKELQMIQHDMAEKQTYYTSMEEMQSEIRRLHHDMKNHLSVISGLELREGNKAKEYAENLMDIMKDAEDYYDTGNAMVDIILNEKSRVARNKRVDFEAVIEKHCLNGYKNTYLCAIFANALDNAMEAAVKADKERRITVQAFQDIGYVIICIRNSYKGVVMDSKGNLKTTKRNTKEHGIGMSSIRTAVRHLEGEYMVQMEDSFSLTITLPQNENYSINFDKKRKNCQSCMKSYHLGKAYDKI